MNPNWSVYFRPVKFGEMLAIGSGINQPENHLLQDKNMFLKSYYKAKYIILFNNCI